ncbi:YcxB family protein (plasmid) [Rhizobium sp. ZPR4]|uniref:YcxB family protein n=1 Tax=Rhizobium sp. ZPR4 TaxID=3158966 RepID=A0AAU7SS63_9HYPH
MALAAFLGLAGMPWLELRAALPVFALVIAAATFGFAFVFPLLIGPVVIHRRFRQDKLLRQAAEISWNEEAYEVNQPGTHNRFAWTDYSKWREGRHTFLFFRSDYSYQVLPKRVLTQEQIDDISKILSRG